MKTIKFCHNLIYKQLNFLKRTIYFNTKFCFSSEIKADNSKDEITSKTKFTLKDSSNNEVSSSDNESTNLNFSSFSNDYMNTKIDLDFEELKVKCCGCGTKLQTKNESSVGFIPETKLKEFYSQKKSETEILTEDTKYPLDQDDIEIIIEGEEKKVIKNDFKDSFYSKYREMKQISKKDNLYCERCYKLSNYKNFEGKDMTKQKAYKYSMLIKKIDANKLIERIFNKIPSNTNIFYVFDIHDMESTINKQLLINLEKKNAKVVFIGNKFDVLPKNTSDDRIRIWVGEKLKNLCKDYLKEYTYVIVSSRTGHNFDFILHKIKKIKEYMKGIKFPRIYILGYTNVGKSTFINKLIDYSNRFKLREMKKHEKDYENADINLSSSNLTSSPLPGTTIGMTKVNDINLGVKIFDTPGIPNKENMSYYMDDFIDIISVNLCQKIQTYSINVKQGFTIWLGAVARIDFMNGDDKYFSFFFSNHVTIHKTPMLNAELVFENQYGKILRPVLKKEFKDVILKKHEINLNCDKFRTLNYDISISGLGWFSVSGKGFCQLIVSVPENVKVTIRNKPLMPYEIKTKGLKKYFGNTMNMNSKINRNFSKKSFENNKSKKIKNKNDINKKI